MTKSHSQPLAPYTGEFQTSGDLEADVKALLLRHHAEATYLHVKNVAATAASLAQQFGGDVETVRTAAWLHDISTIIPNEARLAVARALEIEILPEEEGFPMILHQKLSVVLAHDVFAVTDVSVLSAIECHTTLKAAASLSDKIVFVADKIAWDQTGTPPYSVALQAGLEHSIDAAALAYLDYLWDIRASLRVLHPWAIAARHELAAS